MDNKKWRARDMYRERDGEIEIGRDWEIDRLRGGEKEIYRDREMERKRCGKIDR